MLFESTNLAAPYPEMSSCALDSETCDLSQSKSNFEFKSDEGTTTLPKVANVDGEAEAVGEPPAPENSPKQTLAQHDNGQPQPDSPVFGKAAWLQPPGDH